MANAQNSEIRYLNPPTVEVRKKKYCRFKRAGIKYVDYKDPEFLKKSFICHDGNKKSSFKYFTGLLLGLSEIIYIGILWTLKHSVQFSSVAQSCLTLCDAMD